MKLVSYQTEDREHLGIFQNGHIYNLNSCDKLIPDCMNDFLANWDGLIERAIAVDQAIKNGEADAKIEAFYELLAPVPHPASYRNAYAFRQHAAAERYNRELDMIAEFDEHPGFYFANHHAIQGPGAVKAMPDHFEQLDFELQIAAVISKKGRNIQAQEADSYIAGYLIMNGMCARKLQSDDMKLNLGPGKGRDFSTVIGPWLVTPDELKPFNVAAAAGHTGNQYDLKMQCFVNGIEVSNGSTKEMEWTFAEIIERCAYGTDLMPGDLISSGPVGTGCFMEQNVTGTINDPNYQSQWLQEGDVVEMEITGLGRLSNTILKADGDFSILDLKKGLKVIN